MLFAGRFFLAKIPANIFFRFIKIDQQILVTASEAPDRLHGTLRAAPHGTKRICLAGCTSAQAHHQQNKSQPFQVNPLQQADPADQFLPLIAPQGTQMRDDPRREKHISVFVIHFMSTMVGWQPTMNQPAEAAFLAARTASASAWAACSR
jgi:hypothetical protein